MGPVKDREEVVGIHHHNGFHPAEHLKNGMKSANGNHTPKVRVEFSENPKILKDVLQQIGNTPMIRMNRIPKSEGVECEILAKCELFGPGGSHKDRIALRMIEEAEADGRLFPGSTIIEPTSGNTGIGVAMVSAVKGYKCILVMPEKMSAEKHETMAALGAKVVRTGKNVLHTAVAQQIHKETPNSIILDQYGNDDNPRIHYETTAEEIIEQCDGKIDMIVMGVGTGGIISGIGKKIKEKLPSCIVVGVDPEGSIMALPDSINKTETNFWEVEGIGHDWLPDVLDRSVVDKWVKCNDKDTFNMARRIIKEEGILVGGSCGSALAGAIQAIKEQGLGKGHRCVIILPDSVRNYMSKFLSNQWMNERGFLPDNVEVTNKYGWWTQSVSTLPSRIPPTLSLDASVGKAVALMKKEGVDQLPVVNEEGFVQGTVTLNHLLKTLPTTEITSSTNISKVLFNQYKRVTERDTLGKLNYVLQGAPFAVVIEPVNRVNSEGKAVVLEKLKGVVTSLDLAEFTLLK